MRVFLATAMLCAAFTSAAHAEIASCYGREGGQTRTAEGKSYDPSKLTAAHRTWPFGTRVRVTNLRTGRSVVVSINDRGPFVKGRDIDLSTGSCHAIDSNGLEKVQLDRLSYLPHHGDWSVF